MRSILAGAVFGLATCLCIAAGAGADEKNKIDCSQIDMKFTAPDYDVTCKDFSNSNYTVGETLAAQKTEQLLAVSTADGSFLVAIDHRTLGDRILIKQLSLQADVEAFISGIQLSDWAPITAASGFEVAEVDGTLDGSGVVSCIGFRRIVTRHREGIGRIVVGLACSHGRRGRAYDTLKLLTAPGA